MTQNLPKEKRKRGSGRQKNIRKENPGSASKKKKKRGGGKKAMSFILGRE